MSAGLVRSHIAWMRDGARVFRWEHYELLEVYDAWLRGATFEACWEGEDCLTGGMYTGCGPLCDAGKINWIFQELFSREVCGCTIDVRRPCSSQRHAFANCGWREGWASAGAVLQAMMEHEQALMMEGGRWGCRWTLQEVQAARAALDARRARATQTASDMEEPADMLWEFDDEEDDDRHDSGGDDDDQDYSSHDDDDVQ